MKQLLVIVIILAVISSVTMAEELKKLSLDDAALIGTSIHTDQR